MKGEEKETTPKNRQRLEDMQGKFKEARYKYCEGIVRYPLKTCGCFWFVLLAATVFVIGGGYLSFDDISFADFLVLSAEDTRNNVALTDAKDRTDLIQSDRESIVAPRSELLIFFNLWFLFALPEDSQDNQDLITSETIQQICETEMLFVGKPEFRLYCQTFNPNGENTVCAPQPGFLTGFFYDVPAFRENDGSDANFTCDLLDQTFIDDRINLLIQTENADLFIDDVENPKNLRSQVFLAGPLGEDSTGGVRFNSSSSDFDDEQALLYQELFDAFTEDIFERYGVNDAPFFPAYGNKFFYDPSEGELQVRFYGYFLDSLHFGDVILYDQALTMASLIAVGIVMYTHIRSLFLTVTSMFAIGLSLVFGLFIYEFILRIEYFNNIHIVVIYIILGIGADNVFVLVDAWKQSDKILDLEAIDGEADEGNGMQKQELLTKKLDYTFTRASSAVLNTSVTTGVAFIATGVSPVKTVAAFGFYAAVVVFVNLLLVVTVHSADLIVKETYFPGFKKKKVVNSEQSGPGTDKEEDAASDEKKPNQEGVQIDVVKEDEQARPSCGHRLLTKYVYLVNNTVFPFVSITIMVCFGIFMLSRAARLQTPTQVESNFDEGHMFNGFEDDFNNLFIGGTDDSFGEVEGVFGIADLDISEVKRFSSDDFLGTAVFDDDFRLELQATQDYIIEFCNNLPEVECEAEACNDLGFLFLEETIECFMKDFRDWHLLNHGNLITYVTDSDGQSTGLTLDEFNSRVDEYLNRPNRTFEEPDYRSSVGIIDGKIKFLVITYRNSMKQNQPLQRKEPVLQLLDDLSAETRENAPEGLDTFFQTSFDLVWQHTESGTVRGLFNGLFISAAATYAVLLIGTRNLKVATFALTAVAFIVLCVLGTAQLAGWELGSTEAIAGVMVIGLSVDYTVHLGHMLMISRKENALGKGRLKKAITTVEMIEFAVLKMGGTVIAGAVTTASSAVFLFLSTFVFFSKMAALIVSTVVFSVLFAFLFFVPMCRLFGPGKKEPGYLKKLLQSNITSSPSSPVVAPSV